MESYIKYVGIILALAGLWLIGCGSDSEQRQFEAEASAPPHGITRTDPGGNIVVDDDGNPVEEDPNDWRTAPIYRHTMIFEPAYPNPTDGAMVFIDFRIVHFPQGVGSLVLRGYDDAGRLQFLDEVTQLTQGAYQFSFHPADLSTTDAIGPIRGLHRLWVFDGRGAIVTYGDIRIE